MKCRAMMPGVQIADPLRMGRHLLNVDTGAEATAFAANNDDAGNGGLAQRLDPSASAYQPAVSNALTGGQSITSSAMRSAVLVRNGKVIGQAPGSVSQEIYGVCRSVSHARRIVLDDVGANIVGIELLDDRQSAPRSMRGVVFSGSGRTSGKPVAACTASKVTPGCSDLTRMACCGPPKSSTHRSVTIRRRSR